MGVVYRAEDTSLRRTVALKFLPEHLASDPAVNERLRREARLASSLNHPNICTIYEVGEDSGEVFIAMEYVDGRPLSESIRAEGLPFETTLRYGRQLASALAHAHDHGVVHGDLKPSNIIITPGGDAKILDFGLARRSDPAEFDRQTLETVSAEHRSGLGGTLRYMAPEQIDASPASQSTDLWALGVVLYEMATGSHPFFGENLYLLCTAILRDPPRPLPAKVPAGLASIILHCLEKEPARRYKRAGEVRAALEALTPSQEDIIPAPLPAPRKVPYLPLAAAILLLLAVFGVYKFRGTIGIVGSAGLVPHPVLLGILPPAPSGDSSQSALNIQRAADSIRVNYSLVDTRSHRQVRGGTVTAAAADPFALQDRVFESVALAMELQLAPEERQAPGSQGTTQAAAYDYYVQGRGYLQDYVVPEMVENAVTLFQRALEKDPNYAAATAGLGEAYWRKYQQSHDL